jgi:hypothetical protein
MGAVLLALYVGIGAPETETGARVEGSSGGIRRGAERDEEVIPLDEGPESPGSLEANDALQAVQAIRRYRWPDPPPQLGPNVVFQRGFRSTAPEPPHW